MRFHGHVIALFVGCECLTLNLKSSTQHRTSSGQCLLAEEARSELGQSDQYQACGTTNSYSSVARLKAALSGSLDFVSFLHTPFNFVQKESSMHWEEDKNGTTKHEQMTVWVNGYARSATSTVLSMINAAGGLAAALPATEETLNRMTSSLIEASGKKPGGEEIAAQFLNADRATQIQMLREPQFAGFILDTLDVGPGTLAAAASNEGAKMPEVYALFEPCNPDDKVTGELRNAGCKGLLAALAHCDFSNIESLHGIKNPHTTQRLKDFTPTSASASCSSADLVTIKTIDYGHDLRDAVSVLDSNEKLFLIDVIRDPRGIYASWKATYPFSERLKKQNQTLMTDICDNFAANLHIRHPRLRRVVFEHLVQKPEPVMQGIYDFIGVPFGEAQLSWINATFNNVNCSTSQASLNPNYRDCHTDSSWALHRWQRELTDDEKQKFSTHEACREVAWAFSFEL